ncbi:ribonuclease domain-containing protein [Meiothermus granaticius]|uniref:Guanyl-specific ribonuclease St n=1 Tax=Meiothermus granaticius NBRC 107808 TaxID=1227551 RepID=A0A399FCB3_9DEIN|nr:ribonuclease domain-containing protein [Meiothermus granaticius]RIH92632.1 Guanyl-specific ribonuclease St [Meiothermus granaticius NBRC 107808]GEM87602.1 hypothetical protein MGR01S_22270 [Meiothermus granaticius NBRC 107808]
MQRVWVSFLLAALMLLGFLYLRNQPPSPLPTSSSSLIVHGVRVYDLNGRLAYQGDVDLGPVLERVARGERDPHRDDGTVFANREGRLPAQPRGYYREYVVRTPGLSSVGPQRLVIGAKGEVYYTPDHYNTFIRVR